MNQVQVYTNALLVSEAARRLPDGADLAHWTLAVLEDAKRHIAQDTRALGRWMRGKGVDLPDSLVEVALASHFLKGRFQEAQKSNFKTALKKSGKSKTLFPKA